MYTKLTRLFFLFALLGAVFGGGASPSVASQPPTQPLESRSPVDDSGDFFDLVDEHFVNKDVLWEDFRQLSTDFDTVFAINAFSDFLGQTVNSNYSLNEMTISECFEDVYWMFHTYQTSVMVLAATQLLGLNTYIGTFPILEAVAAQVEYADFLEAEVMRLLPEAVKACNK
jgi:hypothetical protein